MALPVYEFVEQMTRKDDREFFRRCAERVREFNLAAQGTFVYSDSAIARQKSFVKEELLTELLVDGIADKNRTLVIDAICDIFVVSTYWDFITGLQDLMSEEDFDGTFDSAVKWVIQDTNDSLHPGLVARESLSDQVNFMVKGYEGDFPQQVVSSCVAFMILADFDYRRALEEVLSSNESKIPTVEDFVNSGPAGVSLEENMAIESSDIEERSGGRYTDVSGKVVNGRVVFKDANGKIMKPRTFFEPELGNL